MDKEQFIRMFNEDMLLGTPVFEAYTMGKLGECADQRIKEETSK